MKNDWRETVQTAADLAVLGFVLTIAAVPLVTAGAAVAAGSAAVHHYLRYGSWPGATASWAQFRRALAPGLLAGLTVAVAVLLLTVDVLAVRSGAVPGGTPLLLVTAVLTAAGAGAAGLVVVEVGARPELTWRSAVRAVSRNRLGSLPAATGVVAVAALLAALVHPALVPVLAGYALYALHVIARRKEYLAAAP